jgi:chemotaxis response regulator CheB
MTEENVHEPIRCAIVDDEPMGRASLRYVLAEDPEVEIVGEASDGIEALELIRREVPDVVFPEYETELRNAGIEVREVGPEFFGDVLEQWEETWQEKAPVLARLRRLADTEVPAPVETAP